MQSNWPQVIAWIGLSEGGYVNHKNDPGKATNHGITIFTLSDDLGRPATIQDVKDLTKADAERILKARYWDLVKGDQLPSGVDYLVTDYATNSGPGKAAKDLQRTLNEMGHSVKVDGLIGPQTLAALQSMSEQELKELIRLVCERRMRFLRNLKTFKTFGRGWTKRVMGNRTGVQTDDIGVIDRATMLASKHPVSNIPAPENHETAKAEPEKPNVIDALQKPEAWGPLAGLLSALGAAFQGDGPVQYALAALVVAFIAVGVFYAVNRIRSQDPT